MNSWHFHQYLQFPEKLGVHDEVQLRGLVKEYPWFPTAHILLAKCLKNQESYMFEKQLRHAALFAPDRTVLYQMLKKNPIPNAASDVVLSEPIPSIPDNEETVVKESLTEPIGQMEPPWADEPISVEGEVRIADPLEHIEVGTETAISFKHEEKIEEVIEVAYEGIREESRVLENSIVSSLEFEKPIPIETAEIQEPERKTWLKWLGFTDDPIQRIPSQVILKTPEHHNMSLRELMSRMSLDLIGTDVPVSQVFEISSHVKESAPVIPEAPTHEIKGTAENRAVEALVNEEKQTVNVDTQAILEKFIELNPTITRPKASFFNPSDAAQKSLEEHDDIYTETLAKVYIRQEKFSKAIQVYEKLILKFPQEKEKFAALIRQLKEK